MFPGFERKKAALSGAELELRIGGDGPPLLLLHGYPQTHVMWHRLAPALARSFRVIAADLRGYGASSKPPAGSGFEAYSKRAMALDFVELMGSLDFRSFDVVGHDRGGRVAYRMALDHPQHVRRLAVLDIVPTLDQVEQLNWLGWYFSYHWHFLAQPSPLPETLISADAEYFLQHTVNSWCSTPGAITTGAMRAYVEAFGPQTIRATCDDYRAGLFVDRQLDEADRAAGRMIRAPVLVLWSDPQGQRESLIPTWQRWAADVRGRGLRCGHFLAEEAPGEVLNDLLRFLPPSSPGRNGIDVDHA